MNFDALCALLPPETNWGDMLTPGIVEQIALAEREACAHAVERLISGDRIRALPDEIAVDAIRARSD